MSKVTLADVMAEVKVIRAEVKRLHSRLDAASSESPSEDDIKEMAEYQAMVLRELYKNNGLEIFSNQLNLANQAKALMDGKGMNA